MKPHRTANLCALCLALSGCADAPADLVVAILAIAIGLLTVAAISAVVAKVLWDMKRDGGR